MAPSSAPLYALMRSALLSGDVCKAQHLFARAAPTQQGCERVLGALLETARATSDEALEERTRLALRRAAVSSKKKEYFRRRALRESLASAASPSSSRRFMAEILAADPAKKDKLDGEDARAQISCCYITISSGLIRCALVHCKCKASPDISNKTNFTSLFLSLGLLVTDHHVLVFG